MLRKPGFGGVPSRIPQFLKDAHVGTKTDQRPVPHPDHLRRASVTQGAGVMTRRSLVSHAVRPVVPL
jgi:hypothetical protein